MRPEYILLQELLRYLGGRSCRFSSSPKARLDWPFFVKLVEKHRLAPLFYRELKDMNGSDMIPVPVWKAWEGCYHAGLAQTTIQHDLLRNIISALRQDEIDVILLKGVDLAERYYPHPALRPFDDVDLLIREKDKQNTQAILEETGLQLISQTETSRKYALTAGGSRPKIFLEVHSNLQTARRRNPSFEIGIEDFWEASHPVELYEASVRVLNPDLNLIYLCAHLSHHGFSRLIWFYDLHLIVEKSGREIDWEWLIHRSRSYRSATQVFYPLSWTREFFGSAIPKKVLNALSPQVYKSLFLRFFINRKRVLSGGLHRSPEPCPLERFLTNDNWLLALRWYLLKNTSENKERAL